jgi:ATP-dependent RNA helicase DDX54/DBP10
MVKTLNTKSTKNKSFNTNKKYTNDEATEKADRKYSNLSKSEDELEDSDNKASTNKNSLNKNESESEAEKPEDLFNEASAKKYQNENLILETPLALLRKKNDKKAKGFRSFSLSQEILAGVKRMGYKMPTPIQRKCVPNIMSGFNVIAHSRTGSGKTAAFVLPILHRLKEHSKIIGCRCLIVCPTRELAHQTMTFCKKLGKFTNLKYALLVGGNELDGQFERLAQNPDVIIATPGRIVHHLVN